MEEEKKGLIEVINRINQKIEKMIDDTRKITEIINKDEDGFQAENTRNNRR